MPSKFSGFFNPPSVSPPASIPSSSALSFDFKILKEFIGYQHMSNNRLTNFYIGIEASQGLTRGMRDYQIDLMGPYTDNKFDVYLGLRAGWFFPVLRKDPNEFYYN